MTDLYDIIIVGSGLGGLVCAYTLSKNSYKVLVLEKNSQTGGCLQSFSREGVSFDTSLHYLGSLGEFQILKRFFDYLSLSDVKFQALDEEAYDVVVFPENEFFFPRGYEMFESSICEKFPNYDKEIKEYLCTIRTIAENSPLYDFRKVASPNFFETQALHMSTSDYIESLISDKLLQNVLVGNLPLSAGVRGKTPLYEHSIIQNSYIQGAYRVAGGSRQIADSLADSIKSSGGEIWTNSEVSEFVCDESKFVSVKLSDGKEIFAKNCISDIHPMEIINRTKSPILRKAYRHRIENLENTVSNFTLYIKFRPDTLPYLNRNYYVYSNSDVWSSVRAESMHFADNFLYMHQCHELNPKYAKTAVVMSYMNYSELKKWENTIVGRRGDDYENFKREKSEKLLSALESHFPGTLKSVESYYAATPLTYRDYTATYKGSMYGILKDAKNIETTSLSYRTKIPNLYLTGQNVHIHGVLGVIMGAFVNCAEFLGVKKILKDIYCE